MVNPPDAAWAAALGGAGVAHLLDWMAAEDLQAGRLVRLLADHELPIDRSHAVHLLWLRRPAAKTSAFVAFLQARLQAPSATMPFD
jgi:DNA-binding transcriptional LysR family regulator